MFLKMEANYFSILPPELLLEILLKCSAKDLVNLGSTCKHLRDAVQNENIWENLCAKEYYITENNGKCLNTFQKLYQRLLYSYGWMIGLYWSKIDYFGGLLEVNVCGDSIIATSISMSPEGGLQLSPCFEVNASSYPAKQVCSMVERTHNTIISQCKDKDFLRQKCQFTDTKFSQGHYNYNTTNGFRSMIFVDAHRYGLQHQPLSIPPLSSIPLELWGPHPSYPQMAEIENRLRAGRSQTTETDWSRGMKSISPQNKRSQSVDGLKSKAECRDDNKVEEAVEGVIYNLLAKCHMPHNKQDKFQKMLIDDSDYSDSEDEIADYLSRRPKTLTRSSTSANCREVGSRKVSCNAMSTSSSSTDGSSFAKYQNHPAGSSRQELAKLYKETYSQPYPSESTIEATAELLGNRNRHNMKKETSKPLDIKIIPKELPPHVLKPGLYVANKFGHEYELALLEYRIREITLTKILGDQFVPTKEMSLRISLPYSFHLSAEVQRTSTCDQLQDNYPPSSSSRPLHESNEQPFILPMHCMTDCTLSDIPKTCFARYHGFAQVANLFHSQPRFIATHVMVFSNDLFGVIFLQQDFFILYGRLDREFPRRPNIKKRHKFFLDKSDRLKWEKGPLNHCKPQ